MRNRLLPLAVLAIALGLATAAYADISVTTVIANPDGSWDAKVRLWGNGGIGVTADSLGYYDFTFGINGVDGGQVLESHNLAPQLGSGEGFFQPASPNGPTAKNGKLVNGNVEGITSWQNALYGTINDPFLDGMVYANCGIASGFTAFGGWDADMLVASGSWNGTGTLQAAVPGRIAYSVLPNSGGYFVGPMTTIDSTTWVKAVVTQVIYGGLNGSGVTTGNDGGNAAYYAPTAMNVQAGELRFGLAAIQPGMAQFLSLSVDSSKGQVGQQEDASVALDADLSVAALSIAYGQTGFLNGLDLNSPAVSGAYHSLSIYASDAAAAEQAVLAAIANAKTTPQDGIYDSNLHPNAAIGVTDRGGFVLVRATRKGDADCTGLVDGADLNILAGSWNKTSATWDMADFNGDGVVDGADLNILAGGWNQMYTPEPCTIMLLCVGAGALLRRRRRR